MTPALANLSLDGWAALTLDGWATMTLDPVASPPFRSSASQYLTSGSRAGQAVSHARASNAVMGGSRMGQAVTRDTAQLTTGHSEAGEVL